MTSMPWVVAPGPASLELGHAVAERLGCEVVELEWQTLQSGEIRLRLGSLPEGRRVLVVQSTYPPVDRHILELLIICYKLSARAGDVFVVAPYLSFAALERERVEGDIGELGAIADSLASVGVTRLLSVDLPTAGALGQFAFPIHSVSALPLLAQHVSQMKKLQNPVVATPSFTRSVRVEALAKLLGGEDIHAEVNARGRLLDQDLSDRDAILYDEVLTKGEEFARAAAQLHDSGINDIFGLCSHPLIGGDEAEWLMEQGMKALVGSNSVPSSISVVDVSKTIAAHIGTL